MRSFLKLILYLVWHFVISIEFLLALLFIFVYNASPAVRQVFAVGSFNDENLRWCAALPLGISVWIFSALRKILWPNTDRKRIFLTWPGYVRLKSACAVAFSYAVICCVLVVLSVFFPRIFADGLQIYIIVASTAIVFVDAVSCWLASLTAEQILSSIPDD